MPIRPYVAGVVGAGLGMNLRKARQEREEVPMFQAARISYVVHGRADLCKTLLGGSWPSSWMKWASVASTSLRGEGRRLRPLRPRWLPFAAAVYVALPLAAVMLCHPLPDVQRQVQSRRGAMVGLVGGLSAAALPPGVWAGDFLRENRGLPNCALQKLTSGLNLCDIREGTGDMPPKGARVTIDYVMSTTGAQTGYRIDGTRDRDEPFTFTLGDERTIEGLQEAVAGMRPGGVRWMIVPSSLAYRDASKQPQPPDFATLQRFRSIYFNPRRASQPDLVLEVKLLGFKVAP